MHQGEDLTIIMTTFNRWKYTQKTLESLFKTVPNATYIIIDNDSTDDTKDELALLAESENITIILNPENKGWGSAVNYATNYLFESNSIMKHTKYVLISNNDVEYFDGWYDKCIEAYEVEPNIGILGAWKHIVHGIIKEEGNIVYKEQMPAVSWLMTIPHILEIGEFPEHGPCLTKGGNREDVEYCIRAQEKGFYVCGLKEDVANHFDGY